VARGLLQTEIMSGVFIISDIMLLMNPRCARVAIEIEMKQPCIIFEQEIRVNGVFQGGTI